LRVFFFFFKQKTAYEMATGLEFRRVLFRSGAARRRDSSSHRSAPAWSASPGSHASARRRSATADVPRHVSKRRRARPMRADSSQDRKSTRLNSSHVARPYARFGLTKSKSER